MSVSVCSEMLLNVSEYWSKILKERRMGIKGNAAVLRNYTALRGVIKTLRWVISEIEEEPLE